MAALHLDATPVTGPVAHHLGGRHSRFSDVLEPMDPWRELLHLAALARAAEGTVLAAVLDRQAVLHDLLDRDGGWPAQ